MEDNIIKTKKLSLQPAFYLELCQFVAVVVDEDDSVVEDGEEDQGVHLLLHS